MDAGLRRDPRAAAPDWSSNPDLVALIRNEIRARGPITFARFMELALYAPGLGYYVSPETRIGRAGDFLTAPATHPIFGAAVARQVAAVWRDLGRPARFAIREYGAGTGALATAVLDALHRDEPELANDVRYEAVEINPHRRAELERRGDDTPGLVALDPAAAAAAGPTDAGYVIANEYVDAFPVHVVERTAHGLQEVLVDDASDGFVERLGPLRDPAFAGRLAAEGVSLAEGQRAEIAAGLDAWCAEVGRWLANGVAVIVDYGDEARDLFGPRRPRGTLMGYRDHRAVDDPLQSVGRQDLTAHVDFTALANAAARAGFGADTVQTQARWLMDLGLEGLLERARSDRDQGLGDYLALRSALGRLLDPRHTGGFRVLTLRRGRAAGDVRRPGQRLRT